MPQTEMPRSELSIMSKQARPKIDCIAGRLSENQMFEKEDVHLSDMQPTGI